MTRSEPFFGPLEPELGEIRKFLAARLVGIDCQPARGQAVLLVLVDRPEITRAQKRCHFIDVRSAGVDRQPPARESQMMVLELARVDAAVIVVEQFRLERDGLGPAGIRIDVVHAHRRIEMHPDMEEVHPQCDLGIRRPERVVPVVHDLLIFQRRQAGERIGQFLGRGLIVRAGHLLRLVLEPMKGEGLARSAFNRRFGKGGNRWQTEGCQRQRRLDEGASLHELALGMHAGTDRPARRGFPWRLLISPRVHGLPSRAGNRPPHPASADASRSSCGHSRSVGGPAAFRA